MLRVEHRPLKNTVLGNKAMELEGRVALITGGASGIGEASARLFAAEGAQVVIADMQIERGTKVASELGDGAVFQPLNVAKEAEVKAAVDRAVDTFGKLDIVFNNAGFGGVLGPVADTDMDEFDLTFAVLVKGVFMGMKHAAPALRSNGGGSIVNTASIAAIQGGYSPHAYAGAKAAVEQMTKSVALELAEDNIRVNCICPGLIATPLAANTVGRPDELIDAAKAEMAEVQPIRRAGEARDIAEMALWLAGDRSTFVTGQAMVVDGGLTSGPAWRDQPSFHKSARPIKVYRPEGN